MEKVNRRTTEGQGASLQVAPADAAEEELTRQERLDYREDVLDLAGGDYLKFQTQAIRRYGAAGGVMCREILFWDDKGDDPSGGWTYMTKDDCEERIGLSHKAQDGARKRLEDAGVLEVEHRPRRNREGRVTHPSRVLHYRLKLPELLAQMGKDPESLKSESKHADAGTRERGLGDSGTPIGVLERADTDGGARESGPSNARIGVAEHAVTGAPYTEGTPEGTPEATQEETSEETTQATPERADLASRGSAPRRLLEQDSPALLEIMEMIEAAGDGRSEDEHLDALCRLYGVPHGQRNRYGPYVQQALEELQAREGAA